MRERQGQIEVRRTRRDCGRGREARGRWGGGPLPRLVSDLSLSRPSHDQRFFLKTQRRREVRALLTHLPRYVQHLQRHPHSLLARLLGTRDPGTQDSGARGRGEDREREGRGPGCGTVPGSGEGGT